MATGITSRNISKMKFNEISSEILAEIRKALLLDTSHICVTYVSHIHILNIKSYISLHMPKFGVNIEYEIDKHFMMVGSATSILYTIVYAFSTLNNT